jgi:hypothetical protein
MPTSEEDLRSTQESIRGDAEKLAHIEDEKLARDPGDPRVDDLSEQAERLVHGLKDKTEAQRQVSDEIQSDR